MIRTYRETDLEEMVRIWYEASVIAHPFVPASFWASHKSAMKEKYLPLAENYVFEQEGKVTGFISLVGEKVCAIFVAPEMQGGGIGKALLEHAKLLKGRLSLKVYRDNKKAILFYEKSGLRAVGEEVDEHTDCLQVLMEWEISYLGFKTLMHEDFDA
ncbi:Acetyltransferase [Methanosarcina lacustris Z-7289]|uniref:Acetyltransferase n=1 Tax=Methanosarcina lacustris Z-7289 TaxID=1434111 RepID=A0A0E3S5F3_9EURY|nr:N-acetyltransferase [Methanosarcina lacustris]AKB75606.1 Acetyltransferase [Methanosarcina lacustris Z-7289]